MNTDFPSTITEWNKLDLSICNSTSLHIFKGKLLQFVRPLENSVFTFNNPIRINYLIKLRLEFGYLCYHKFKQALGALLYNALLHQVGFAVKSRRKAILKRYVKKLITFPMNQNIHLPSIKKINNY